MVYVAAAPLFRDERFAKVGDSTRLIRGDARESIIPRSVTTLLLVTALAACDRSSPEAEGVQLEHQVLEQGKTLQVFDTWVHVEAPPTLPLGAPSVSLQCSIDGDKIILDYGTGQYELVKIPAGSFLMGPPGEEKEVHLTYDFYIGTTAVTREFWWTLAGADEHPSRPNVPVYNGNGYYGDAFGLMLTQACGLDAIVFRLPTEAEWERAARGPSGEDGIENASAVRVSIPEGAELPGPYSARMGSPNGFGLYAMVGNAGEHCLDYLQPYPPADTVNPIGAYAVDQLGSEVRSRRGGSWDRRGGTWDPKEPTISTRERRPARQPAGMSSSFRIIAIERSRFPQAEERVVSETEMEQYWW